MPAVLITRPTVTQFRFFPSSDWNHRRYSLRLPTEVWQGWVGLGGSLHTEVVCPPKDGHPSQY